MRPCDLAHFLARILYLSVSRCKCKVEASETVVEKKVYLLDLSNSSGVFRSCHMNFLEFVAFSSFKLLMIRDAGGNCSPDG